MNFKLCLAPIRGITDYIFRNTFTKYFNGIDNALAPFIATSEHKKITPALLKDLLPENNPGLPVIPQILSNKPADFIAIARMLNDYGYSTVNWNLGCPFPMVVKKMKGSGLLPYPAKVENFLSEVISRIPNKLSIKCRLGLQYKEELIQLFPIFNQYALEKIIIHPRTGKQMYKGNVDIAAFKNCLHISKHPIIYNGDIKSLKDFTSLQKKFSGIKEWMLGRGLLYDLFLAEKIKNIHNHFLSLKDKKIILKNFHNDIFLKYSEILSGPAHLLDKMKAFWHYFSNNFPENKKILKKIKKSAKIKTYLKNTEIIFN